MEELNMNTEKYNKFAENALANCKNQVDFIKKMMTDSAANGCDSL